MITGAALAQTNGVRGDNWLPGGGAYPGIPAQDAQVRSNAFSGLNADFIAGRVKVSWPGGALGKDASVYLVSSEEAPGHWPSRDWRREAMAPLNGAFEQVVKVEDLDVPLIYFVEVVEGPSTWKSPMRIFQPRQAGMEMPTRLFWSFLEGFEEGAMSWKLLSQPAEGGVLQISAIAKTGKASLQVVLGPKQRSVTVGTTRLRGSQIVKQRATGVRFWMRTGSGKGRVRVTLHANAFTPEQVIAVAPRQLVVNEQWQQVDFSLSDFPPLPLAGVDFLSLEFSGEGAREFLLDNLELLGPWKADE